MNIANTPKEQDLAVGVLLHYLTQIASGIEPNPKTDPDELIENIKDYSLRIELYRALSPCEMFQRLAKMSSEHERPQTIKAIPRLLNSVRSAIHILLAHAYNYN